MHRLLFSIITNKCTINIIKVYSTMWTGQCSRYSDWLWAGRSGIESLWGRDFPPVHTGSRAHPASSTMGTGSFPWVKRGGNVTLTPNPLLVPWSRKSRAIPLLPLWAVRPVQSLSARTRVHFTLLLCITTVCLCNQYSYMFRHFYVIIRQ